MTDWWRTFFDDAYVQAWEVDGAFDATADDAAALVTLLDLEPGAAILDLPCGFGRFSRPLHEAGFQVTGVDGSPDQVRLARERNPGRTTPSGTCVSPHRDRSPPS